MNAVINVKLLDSGREKRKRKRERMKWEEEKRKMELRHMVID